MSFSRRNGFFKGHALGNDYIVVDPQILDFRLSPGTVQLICDRNRGLGADGVIALGSSGVADFGISIYNADGSEAEISGNGLRIFGLYAHSVCGTTGSDVRVETMQSDADRGGGLTRPIGKARFVGGFQPAVATLGGLRRARGLYTYELPVSSSPETARLRSLQNHPCPSGRLRVRDADNGCPLQIEERKF